MSFNLTILGSNSAIPAYGRHPTAQILSYNHHQYLIDCGEGTQVQFQRYGIKRSKLDHAFISHLHGDHYFGLIGLITSFSLNGRQQPFHIYCPEGLEEIISVQLGHGRSTLSFETVFHTLNAKEASIICETEHFLVESITLDHRIDCFGFIFREKSKDRNIIPSKIAEHQLTIPEILKIKKGMDLERTDGTMIKNEALTKAPPRQRSYAFVTDTLYKEDIIPKISGVDLLYHEATFGHAMLDRAKKTFHTTAKQAAEMAKNADVKQLIIGHFSSRYDDLQILLDEARSVFPNTELAIEGGIFDI